MAARELAEILSCFSRCACESVRHLYGVGRSHVVCHKMPTLRLLADAEPRVGARAPECGRPLLVGSNRTQLQQANKPTSNQKSMRKASPTCLVQSHLDTPFTSPRGSMSSP